MSQTNSVELHPRRAEIEALLAANAPLSVIVERYGVSRFSAGRRRKRMKAKEPSVWRALRREAAAAGLTRKSFLPANLLAESPSHD